MKLFKPLAALALVFSIGAAASPAAAESPAKPRPPKTYCSDVEASGTGIETSPGVTTADITAGHGLPIGTTTGTFTATGGTPPVVTIAGPIVYTAKLWRYTIGTLTVDVTGTFDTASGAFTATGPITGSTGILRGLTGTLTFSGVEDLTDLTFTETITGTLCAPTRWAGAV